MLILLANKEIQDLLKWTKDNIFWNNEKVQRIIFVISWKRHERPIKDIQLKISSQNFFYGGPTM